MGKSEKVLYLVEAKSPFVDLNKQDFREYIADNEEFKKFSQGVLDIEGTTPVNPLFQRYVKKVVRVSLCDKVELVQEDDQGIQSLVELKKGKAKIGYTSLSTKFIYVEYKGTYFRGFKALVKDLCLVNAMDFVPLDKSTGEGNVEIKQHNKRKATKAIKVIHNEIESILYLVDKTFESKEDMARDKEHPEDSKLGMLIESML